jgi:hypothetical protein
MYNINVPDHIENEAAYIRGAHAHIRANAAKGRRTKWLARDEDAQRLMDWLSSAGEFAGWFEIDGVRVSKEECEASESAWNDSKWVHHPATYGMFQNDFGQFLLGLSKSITEFGALTEKQAQVVRDGLARKEQWVVEAAKNRAAALEADRQSVFVGELKERRDWVLTISKVFSYDGEWGTTYTNLMKDAAGNVVVGKGTKCFGKEGSTIKVKATVVKHETRDGVNQTIINRPKFEEVT